MKQLTVNEAQQVSGNGTALAIAETWVGTVAGVALGAVGAPLLVGAAVGLGLGLAFIAIDHELG